MSEEIDDKLRDKAWTKQDEYFREGNVRLVGAAQKAVNSALWLNGGAVVVMLGFLASVLAKAEARPFVDSNSVRHSLLCFAAGALAAAVASSTSYLTDYFYMASNSALKTTWESPFVSDTPASKRWRSAGKSVHLLSILLVLLSYVTFTLGALRMVGALDW